MSARAHSSRHWKEINYHIPDHYCLYFICDYNLQLEIAVGCRCSYTTVCGAHIMHNHYVIRGKKKENEGTQHKFTLFSFVRNQWASSENPNILLETVDVVAVSVIYLFLFARLHTAHILFNCSKYAPVSHLFRVVFFSFSFCFFSPSGSEPCFLFRFDSFQQNAMQWVLVRMPPPISACHT